MAFGWVPMKVKSELHARGLAACHADIHIGDSVDGAQSLQGFEQGLVITSDTSAGDQVQVADFKRLGREAAVFWKALGQTSENTQSAHRFVEPRAVLLDLALQCL